MTTANSRNLQSTKATYDNRITRESWTLSSDTMTLEKAWKFMSYACQRAGWNEADANMGNIKVTIH